MPSKKYFPCPHCGATTSATGHLSTIENLDLQEDVANEKYLKIWGIRI